MINRIDPEVWLDRIERLDVLRDMVVENIELARDKQERHYNKGKIHATYKVGDMVMRRVHALSDACKKFNAKLAPKYEGPFQVTEVKSPTVYVIDSKERGSRRFSLIHVSELKRYVPPRGLNT